MDKLMEQLVKQHFPVMAGDHRAQAPLDYEEHNAVRYTAGYVIRSLTRKVNCSSHLLKKELTLCLEELGDESSGSGHPSEDWLNAIDRGGLRHVNDATYLVFTAMEEALRRHINATDASLVNIKHAVPIVRSDKDVLFHWAMVSVNWNEKEASVLFSIIVEHWITLRGFSFASALMEKYKQSCRKRIQKSKGVRKRLQTE